MNQLIKLKFLSPVHFGSGRLTDSNATLAADTLFSALFIEALSLGCSEGLLAAAQSGDLQISDTFPWVGNTFYLPKPRISVNEQPSHDRLDEKMNSIKKKAFKKLVYIPSASLDTYLNGEIDPLIEKDNFKLGNSGLTTKVSLENRDNPDNPGDPEPYHVGAFAFKKNAGLYFLVKGNYDLSPLLESLKYSGLGGKRTSGYGRFEFEVGEDCVTSANPKESALNLLLSSAMPKAEELKDNLLDGAAYSLNRRAGFVQSTTYSQQPTKKRDFYSFAAGSVFPHTFEGDVFDVSSGGSHPVWRYAKSMWMEV